MGFEVYLQCFDRGDTAGIPRSSIRPLFPIVEDKSEQDLWYLRYDDLNCCHVSVQTLTMDASQVAALSVWGPCKDRRLWDALYVVLCLGNVVFYYPGCTAPYVASNKAAEHLPVDLVQALGQPIVVESGKEMASEMV
jgi:hypothetical protein